MKFAAGMLTALLTVQPAPQVETVTETVVRPVQMPDMAGRMGTPILDSFVDWDELDRQNDCLWEFLQAHDVELTLESVWAAGEWTDALGGACLVIGEDDE